MAEILYAQGTELLIVRPVSPPKAINQSFANSMADTVTNQGYTCTIADADLVAGVITLCKNILNCDKCKYYNWYYDWCKKWYCEADGRAVYPCFEHRT